MLRYKPWIRFQVSDVLIGIEKAGCVKFYNWGWPIYGQNGSICIMYITHDILKIVMRAYVKLTLFCDTLLKKNKFILTSVNLISFHSESSMCIRQAKKT